MKNHSCLFDIAKCIESHFRSQAIIYETQFCVSFIPSSIKYELYPEMLVTELEKQLLPAFQLSRHGMVLLQIRIQTDHQQPVLYYQICDSRQAGVLEKIIRVARGQSWVDWLELFGTKYSGEFHFNVEPIGSKEIPLPLESYKKLKAS